MTAAMKSIQGSRNRNVAAQQALDNTVNNDAPENGTWVTEGGYFVFRTELIVVVIKTNKRSRRI